MIEEYDIIPSHVPAPLLSGPYSDLQKQGWISTQTGIDVHRATVGQAGQPRELALKEIRPEEFTQTVTAQRLDTALTTWQRLGAHDHTVSVYSWGHSPMTWIAMEYMDGGSLQSRLDRTGVAESLWIASRVATALQAGHSQDVTHQHVTPSNILFRKTSPESWAYPKLGDWGLAKLLDRETVQNRLAPAYAAPEQLRRGDGSADERTDIYQLGAVTYALLTGDPPFTTGSTDSRFFSKQSDEQAYRRSPDRSPDVSQSIREAVLDTPVSPPSTSNAAVPEEVDELLLGALAKSQADRYQTIEAFRKDLETLCEDCLDGVFGPGLIPQPTDGQKQAPETRREETDSPAAVRWDGFEDTSWTRRRFATLMGLLGGSSLIALVFGENALDLDPRETASGSETSSTDTESTATPVQPETDSLSQWLSDANNYEGIVDKRGRNEILIEVGAGRGLSFGPPAVRIDPETTVSWEWTGQGGAHNVVTADGTVESELVSEKGYSVLHTFGSSGTTRYYCTPHRAVGMKGAVIVG